MHLYNVTLQKPTGLSSAILGNFSGAKQQEICIVRGTHIIELLRVDSNTGKLTAFCSQEVFGIIRSIIPVRLTGGSKDYIVIGSDSGYVVILEYDTTRNALVKLHQEPYGKSGCRRITPGQYLAADPKGRAFMLSAVEKQKLVYILNRDSENHLTISSPLEAHKSHTITFCMVGLDVEYDNPLFACLEFDYHDFDKPVEDANNEPPQKLLALYELDLGLNHVVRKWTEVVDKSANLLVPIPSGKEGPGGVLVCSEGHITWKKPNQSEIRVHFPKRVDENTKEENLIISYAVHKMKQFFFVIVQTENGDLFKLTMDWKEDTVEEMKLRYFDTIPPSLSMEILKSGFLFSSAEHGNNYFYQIESLGDEEGEEEWSNHTMEDDSVPRFTPRSQLTNLTPVDQLMSSNPCIQTKVLNITGDDTPQIYSICGTGPNSSFKIQRHGLEVTELVSYPLPGTPNGVWSLKAKNDDTSDSYIVLSFVNATLVLSVGETVEEVSDFGFQLESMTVDCHQIGESSLVQIHPSGIVHVRADGKINEWSAQNKTVTHACCNNRQITLALDAREIVYFEVDDMDNLNEYQERVNMTSVITCMTIGPIPEGRTRSSFLAIGCSDSTVRMISLKPETVLSSMGMQALNSVPNSLLISEFLNKEKDQSFATTYLNIGLDNGVLIRTVLDSITGTMSDSRSRYLGSTAVRLFSIKIQETPAVLALSSKPWLCFSNMLKVSLEPVTYERLEYGSSFTSEQCPEGILAIAEDTLRILTVDNIDSVFNTVSIPLQYTPRHFVFEQSTSKFVIIEGDHRMSHEAVKEKPLDENGNEEEEEESAYRYVTRTKSEEGTWASIIRVLDPMTGDTDQIIELDKNEMVSCLSACVFYANPTSIYYAVGTGINMRLAPRSCGKAYIRLYKMNMEGKLEFIHKTEVANAPGALCQFQGRLLAGIDNTLRIYELGKIKLLRKTETSVFPRIITELSTQGDRIFVSDVQNSVFISRYIYQENVIIVFADDITPRFMTKFTVLDYNTICGADKFGNIFVRRLSKDDIDDLEEDFSGTKIMHDKKYLHGASRKLQRLCEFHVGDIVTSLERCVLVAGGREILLYSTLMGAVGMLIPFPSREDVDLFSTLEMHMRQELPPLCGRDHLTYRSYYFPVKCVVDGDLVEMYNQLPLDRKQEIADQLDRSPAEISRQIELIRARVS